MESWHEIELRYYSSDVIVGSDGSPDPEGKFVKAGIPILQWRRVKMTKTHEFATPISQPIGDWERVPLVSVKINAVD